MTSTPSSSSSLDSSPRPVPDKPKAMPALGALEKIVVGVLAFVGGACILSMEILGGRVLQPEFGSGLYVWGSILSVFMVSLSIGYWLGGKLSERGASLKVLMIFPFVGGCIIALLPNVYGFVNQATFELVVISWDSQESYASLMASTALFLLPSAVLGCISPYSVRLLARTVSTSGRTAGNLYALSTVGSTLGALGTSFWLVPWQGAEALFRMLGGILIGVSLLGFLVALVIGRKKDEQSSTQSAA
jgi:hypothetical protein